MKNETFFMAKVIIDKGMSIRQVASQYGISKSALHYRLHAKWFQRKYPSTYLLLKQHLKEHFETKHIKGGQATAALHKNNKEKQNND